MIDEERQLKRIQRLMKSSGLDLEQADELARLDPTRGKDAREMRRLAKRRRNKIRRRIDRLQCEEEIDQD